VTVVVSLAVPVNGPPVLKPVAPAVGAVIVSTGAVWSIVNVGPVALVAELPALSVMDAGFERLSPTVPSPEPVFAVTVHVLPLTVALATEVPVTPAPAAVEKLAADTPVTDSLKVTVHCTVDELVGVEPARVIVAVGGVRSIV
jgi:hypothetical protein